jgi:hypothetical protein
MSSARTNGRLGSNGVALASRGQRFTDREVGTTLQGVQPAGHSYGPSLEQQWIKRNGAQYKGEWVVLDGDRLVGHGPNPKEFYDLARAQGVISPYVVEIPSEEELPFGGW